MKGSPRRGKRPSPQFYYAVWYEGPKLCISAFFLQSEARSKDTGLPNTVRKRARRAFLRERDSGYKGHTLKFMEVDMEQAKQDREAATHAAKQRYGADFVKEIGGGLYQAYVKLRRSYRVRQIGSPIRISSGAVVELES